MRKNPFHPGPLEQLSQESLAALHRIKRGERITARQYVELEIEDLIRPGLTGWMLTDIGAYRLERGQ
jgi:hypothetical protein